LTTFADLDLLKPLQRAIDEQGYKTPTPIQAKTIPDALQGRDVLGCAQTGTGKTAAFALPILDYLADQEIKSEPKKPVALILAPTRELAIQIDESFKTYGKYLKLKRALVYGGVGQAKQTRAMEKGVHIVVATPGRLLDLMEQGYIKLDRLDVFVLDEADRMLDMGFLPDLKRIIKQLPDERQSLFFSATMPPKIVQLSKQLLHKPVSVNVTPKSTSVQLIKQKVIHVDRTDKQELLASMLQKPAVDRAIIFTRTKRGANTVARKLVNAGIEAVPIHGNKSQNARQRALDDFRSKRVQVLVATDVAARGIDIDGVTHVVNFDMPVEPEAYVHRIGRTGRAGANGIAISFCTRDEQGELRDIEKLIGKKIPSSNHRGSGTGSSDDAPSRSGSRSGQRSARGGAAGKGAKRGGYRSQRKSNDGRTTSPAKRKRSNATASDTSDNQTARRRKKSPVKKAKSSSGSPRSSGAKKSTTSGQRKSAKPGKNARKKGRSDKRL